MKLAILETGTPPGDLGERFGDYPAMFSALLGDGFEVESFDVRDGHFPASGGHGAYLITGSPAGVYDPLPWIAPLMDFVRSAASAKMVGVCFGHQVMAEALGGRVEKSHKGWGAGLHRYAVDVVEPWMDPIGSIAIPASHQDQVVVQPPCTEVTVSSDFTPFAGLSWTDRRAISFQFHPEFSPAFAKALIEKRYDDVPNPDAAIATLDAPNDGAVVGSWIRQFLLESE
jgi:GMP synthase-like glutamine amidotransferase